MLLITSCPDVINNRQRGQFVCKPCGKCFPDLGKLINHMDQRAPCSWQCLLFSTIYGSISAYEWHIKQHKDDMFFNGKYKCTECGCARFQYINLVRHIAIKHKQKALKTGRAPQDASVSPRRDVSTLNRAASRDTAASPACPSPPKHRRTSSTPTATTTQ